MKHLLEIPALCEALREPFTIDEFDQHLRTHSTYFSAHPPAIPRHFRQLELMGSLRRVQMGPPKRYEFVPTSQMTHLMERAKARAAEALKRQSHKQPKPSVQEQLATLRDEVKEVLAVTENFTLTGLVKVMRDRPRRPKPTRYMVSEVLRDLVNTGDVHMVLRRSQHAAMYRAATLAVGTLPPQSLT